MYTRRTSRSAAPRFGMGLFEMSTSVSLHMSELSLFFFFSSRRRHTRYWRDWSSDVCSSDLVTIADEGEQVVEHKFWLHAAIAQSAETPQREGTLRGIFANQFHEAGYGSGGFAEIVGGEDDFNGCAAHAKIFGFHGAQHQVEEPVGILQATAPAFDALSDEVERPLIAANGEG